MQELENLPPESNLETKLEPAIKRLLEDDIQADIGPDMLQFYLRLRKCFYYYDGHQYLVPTFVGDVIDFTPVGTVISAKRDDEGIYDYIQNVVRGDGRKFVGLLGNRAPNAIAVADDQSSEESHRVAAIANRVLHMIYSWWDMEQLHRFLCLQLWKAGTAFIYTPYVVDADRYGTVSEPVWETQKETVPSRYVCPQCGATAPVTNEVCECGQPFSIDDLQPEHEIEVPKVVGVKHYPVGRVECHIFNALHVMVPYYCRTLAEAPWLKLEYDEHRAKLMRAYPEHADMIRKVAEEEKDPTSAAKIRHSVRSPMSMWSRRKHLVTYTRLWLRPSMFGLIADDEARKTAFDMFPTGMKVTLIGGKVVRLERESIDEVWAICRPEPGEHIYSTPLAWDHVQTQDIINALLNIAVETAERAVPWLMADPSVVDFQQLRSRARRPAEVVPVVPGQGRTLREAVKEAPVAQPSPFLTQLQSQLIETVRDIAGVQRTVWGGDVRGNMTARQYEGMRNQALMQLSSVWSEIRSAWGQALANALRQVSKYGSVDNIDLARLADPVWHIEIEETMPITPGQRADRLLFLLEKGPPLVDILGLTHPANVRVAHELLGLSGISVPSLDELEAVRARIRELLNGAPIESVDPQTGEPTEEPSIQPEWAEDSNIWVHEIKRWAMSEEGQTAQRENPTGWRNVMAYGKAHERRLQAPPEFAPSQPISPQPFEPAPPRPKLPEEAA